MATVTKKYIRNARSQAAPYGNAWRQRYNLTTNASGVLVDSDQATAIAVSDIVRLGILPAGIELHDAIAIISDAFTASTTFKLGFQYVDGVDVTAVPQDDDFFIIAGASLATAARLVATGIAAPVVLPKDAYLILTNAGANHASVGIVDFIIRGQSVGV